MFCCRSRRKRPPVTIHPGHIPHAIAGGSRFLPAIPARCMAGRGDRRSSITRCVACEPKSARPARQLARGTRAHASSRGLEVCRLLLGDFVCAAPGQSRRSATFYAGFDRQCGASVSGPMPIWPHRPTSISIYGLAEPGPEPPNRATRGWPCPRILLGPLSSGRGITAALWGRAGMPGLQLV